ncbi:MAG TPA: pilus assembly protein PilF [Desulfobacteraceae bacterium]|nr:pilus assembly protein PilF [Desulfobacteraceae bacterium]
MKRLFTLILLLSLAASCIPAVQHQNKEKIAQAIKKEGEAYLFQGNNTAALAKFIDAEKLTPDDPYLQNSLGIAYMRKNEYTLAEEAFARALSLKPDFTEARNNIGAAYLMQEKWETAITQFNEVLKDLTYPTPHYPLANIGWAYLEKGNYSKAQTYFIKALEESPVFIKGHHGLAQVYIRTGQTRRAIEYLQNKIQRFPNAAILHADIAEAYEDEGETRKAVSAWMVVVRLSPQHTSLFRTAQKRLRALN